MRVVNAATSSTASGSRSVEDTRESISIVFVSVLVSVSVLALVSVIVQGRVKAMVHE
jgi:hypothetical protein